MSTTKSKRITTKEHTQLIGMDGRCFAFTRSGSEAAIAIRFSGRMDSQAERDQILEGLVDAKTLAPAELKVTVGDWLDGIAAGTIAPIETIKARCEGSETCHLMADMHVVGKAVCRSHHDDVAAEGFLLAPIGREELFSNSIVRLLSEAHRHVTDLREQLADSMLRLASNLERSAERLRQDPAMASINSLGEIQSRGLDIDRTCALLDAALKHRGSILYVALRQGK